MAATSRKRKAPAAELSKHPKPAPEQRPRKKARRRDTRLARIARGIPSAPAPTESVPKQPLNAVPNPEETFSVFHFGDGDMGALGLGTKVTEASRPKRNPFLDPADDAAFHITRIACGGIHTIALTNDNKILSWGVNDCFALGRNTDWDGGLRDADAESDDEDGDLNPLESTPMAIDSGHFPPETKFVDVAAGDNCSLALTDDGHVYAWGTFRVRLSTLLAVKIC